jgi:hypothetical protein
MTRYADTIDLARQYHNLVLAITEETDRPAKNGLVLLAGI